MFNQMIDAQKRFQLELLAKANVVGVAVGFKNATDGEQGQLALIALVERKVPLAVLDENDKIPKDMDGATTDVLEVGRIEALNVGPRDRWRPIVPAGVSIGHPRVTAGTLGAIVKDRRTGEKLLLSNNHVMANTNDSFVGDPIIQPGATDGGQNPADAIARLERFKAIRFVDDPVTPDPTPTNPTPTPNPTPNPGGGGSSCDIASVFASIGNGLARLNGSQSRLVVQSAGATTGAQAVKTVSAQAAIPTNAMDVAVAKPLDPAMFSGEIMNIGKITGTKAPALGMQVRKSGRTTGFTQGVITLMNTTIDVNYGGRTARFTGQIVTSGMSQPGDSGSLIVEVGSQNAVGLLFAGSGQATVFTPIDLVLNEMQLMF